MMDDLAELIRKADAGSVKAMVEVADYILWDDPAKPVEKDPCEKAIGYLKKAIAAGNTEAMVSYGAVFYNGRGTAQNFKEAVRWYREAAERGNQTAISYMGYMYYYGREGTVDMEQAYKWFSKAALLSVPNAYYKCGDMYLNGLYVDKDPNTAYQLYRIAYNLTRNSRPLDCYPDVCRRLGSCFHKGIGTAVDLCRAEYFLNEARMGFRQRVSEGDLFTGEVLKKADEEWLEVSQELEKQPRQLVDEVSGK